MEVPPVRPRHGYIQSSAREAKCFLIANMVVLTGAVLFWCGTPIERSGYGSEDTRAVRMETRDRSHEDVDTATSM